MLSEVVPICAGSLNRKTTASQVDDSGATPTPALHFQACDKQQAVEFIRQWHSRLPNCQRGPWQFAFSASVNDEIFAAALWNNPSARTLPGHWLELRRLAAKPGAPRNTCSCFIAWMVRYFRRAQKHREKCISYQDLEVHKGTIYKAAGWKVEFVSKPRVRDRSKARVGTSRAYRSDINGISAAASAKARWSIML